MDKAKEKESESLPVNLIRNSPTTGNLSKRHSEKHPTVFTNRRIGCFICGLEGHFPHYCVEQFANDIG